MALKKRKKVKKAAKKAIKRNTKKSLKKPIRKRIAKKRVVKKSSTHKKPAKSLRKTQRKPSLKKKRPVIKKTAAKKTIKNEGKLIGSITHYFPHVQAAVIKLKGPLYRGDTVKIKGHTTDITQTVTSMQIDRVDIQSAKKGDEIGLQVTSRVRQQDKVYRI